MGDLFWGYSGVLYKDGMVGTMTGGHGVGSVWEYVKTDGNTGMMRVRPAF